MNVGDKILITKDEANGAEVHAGDLLTVDWIDGSEFTAGDWYFGLGMGEEQGWTMAPEANRAETSAYDTLHWIIEAAAKLAYEMVSSSESQSDTFGSIHKHLCEALGCIPEEN